MGDNVERPPFSLAQSAGAIPFQEQPAFEAEKIDSTRNEWLNRLMGRWMESTTDRLTALEDEVDRLKRELGRDYRP